MRQCSEAPSHAILYISSWDCTFLRDDSRAVIYPVPEGVLSSKSISTRADKHRSALGEVKPIAFIGPVGPPIVFDRGHWKTSSTLPRLSDMGRADSVNLRSSVLTPSVDSLLGDTCLRMPLVCLTLAKVDYFNRSTTGTHGLGMTTAVCKTSTRSVEYQIIARFLPRDFFDCWVVPCSSLELAGRNGKGRRSNYFPDNRETWRFLGPHSQPRETVWWNKFTDSRF